MEPRPKLTSPLLAGRGEPPEPFTIMAVIGTIWSALTLRDNWQGEFCVALFGSVGWTATAYLIDEPANLHRPQQYLLDAIAPQWAWGLWFLFFGLCSLHGLREISSRSVYFRLAGSIGILAGFVFVFVSLLVTSPWVFAVPMYMACLMIEFFATIFHTAQISRATEGFSWRSIVKR